MKCELAIIILVVAVSFIQQCATQVQKNPEPQERGQPLPELDEPRSSRGAIKPNTFFRSRQSKELPLKVITVDDSEELDSNTYKEQDQHPILLSARDDDSPNVSLDSELGKRVVSLEKPYNAVDNSSTTTQNSSQAWYAEDFQRADRDSQHVDTTTETEPHNILPAVDPIETTFSPLPSIPDKSRPTNKAGLKAEQPPKLSNPTATLSIEPTVETELNREQDPGLDSGQVQKLIEQTTPKADANHQPESEPPSPSPQTQPQPDPDSQLKLEPQPEPDTLLRSEPLQDPKPQLALEPQPEPDTLLRSEPLQNPKLQLASEPQSDLNPQLKSEPEPDRQLRSVPQADPDTQLKLKPKTAQDPQLISEPQQPDIPPTSEPLQDRNTQLASKPQADPDTQLTLEPQTPQDPQDPQLTSEPQQPDIPPTSKPQQNPVSRLTSVPPQDANGQLTSEPLEDPNPQLISKPQQDSGTQTRSEPLQDPNTQLASESEQPDIQLKSEPQPNSDHLDLNLETQQNPWDMYLYLYIITIFIVATRPFTRYLFFLTEKKKLDIPKSNMVLKSQPEGALKELINLKQKLVLNDDLHEELGRANFRKRRLEQRIKLHEKLRPLKEEILEVKQRLGHDVDKRIGDLKAHYHNLKLLQSKYGKNKEFKKKIRDAKCEQLLSIQAFVKLEALLDIMNDIDFREKYKLLEDSTFEMEVQTNFLSELMDIHRDVINRYKADYEELQARISSELEIHNEYVQEKQKLRLLIEELDFDKSMEAWNRKIKERKDEAERSYTEYRNNYAFLQEQHPIEAL